MARFGTFAVVSKAIVIDQGANVAWPEDAVARNYIDGHVFDKLKKLRVPPAELCSDQVFVRRAYVDILGTIPTSEETEAFLNDADPEKRAKLVDTLLERPEFSDLWAMKWAEVLRVAEIPNVLDRKGMHRYNDWLRAVISANEPLDEVVRELLSAEGGNFTNPLQFLPYRARPGHHGRKRRPGLHGDPDFLRPVPQPPLRALDHGRLLLLRRVLRPSRPKNIQRSARDHHFQ